MALITETEKGVTGAKAMVFVGGIVHWKFALYMHWGASTIAQLWVKYHL